MSTNKEYRNHEGYEDAIYKLYDIMDLCDECIDHITNAQVNDNTFSKLHEMIAKANEVKNLISK